MQFLQICVDSLQNWRSPGSNLSKKIPSSVASLIPGRLPKKRLRRRKDGCLRASGSTRWRFHVSNGGVRSSVCSAGYLEAVGGYLGLIRSPHHLPDNSKLCFRPERARDSKNHCYRVTIPGMSLSMVERDWETSIVIREAWELPTGPWDGPKTTGLVMSCLLYTSPSPRDKRQSRMPSSA